MVKFVAEPAINAPPDRVSHNWAHRQFRALQNALEALDRDLIMRWQGSWNGGNYLPGDVVIDWPYLMLANKPTSERPAPQPVGDPAYLYDGAAPTLQTTAKTLVFGTNFANPTQAYMFKGYRIFTVSGNRYRTYMEVNGQITELFVFTADTVGWSEFTWNDLIVPQNSDFTLFVEVQEPDPTPATFTLSYDYDTPNNTSVPLTGQISHANQSTSELRVHKTDQNGDQSAQLALITPGDTIDGAGIRWSVQAVADNGTWINFAVAPTSQGAPDGVQDFTFETVTATPITVMSDPDYWLPSPNVQSFYGIDGGDPVATQDAYGVDILVQDVSISEDWDILAISGGAGGGAGGITDHGDLTGLEDDDHPHYLNQARADADYLRLDATNHPVTGNLDVSRLGDGAAVQLMTQADDGQSQIFGFRDEGGSGLWTMYRDTAGRLTYGNTAMYGGSGSQLFRGNLELAGSVDWMGGGTIQGAIRANTGGGAPISSQMLRIHVPDAQVGNYSLLCVDAAGATALASRGDGYMRSTTTYNLTNTAAANLNIDSSGFIRRTTATMASIDQVTAAFDELMIATGVSGADRTSILAHLKPLPEPDPVDQTVPAS